MLSIGGSCIGAMSASRILLGKLDMEVMLNATLAGGVAIGSLADFVE
jgi:ammonia channel protein AmtB